MIHHTLARTVHGIICNFDSGRFDQINIDLALNIFDIYRCKVDPLDNAFFNQLCKRFFTFYCLLDDPVKFFLYSLNCLRKSRAAKVTFDLEAVIFCRIMARSDNHTAGSIQFLGQHETIGVEEILSERITLMPLLPSTSATFSANSCERKRES